MEQSLIDELNEKGFLSSSINVFRARYKRVYREAFEEVEVISDTAQALIMRAGADEALPHMIAALVLFHKTVRSCQAAVLLCERGLVVDAQILTRSAVEGIFHAVALVKDPSVLAKMHQHGDAQEKKQAEGMINDLSELGLTEKNKEDLSEVISRAEGSTTSFSAYDAARIAGLIPLYQTIYRGLSALASHATLRSMDSSLFIKDGSPVLVTGPAEHQLEFTLDLVKVCLELSNSKLREHFLFDE